MTYIVPALRIVDVSVVGRVKVAVVVAASDAPMLLAFSMAAGAMGTPYASHVSATGRTKTVVLSLLSQPALMQVMTLIRKLPFESRQRHLMSRPLQVKSPDCLMQS